MWHYLNFQPFSLTSLYSINFSSFEAYTIFLHQSLPLLYLYSSDLQVTVSHLWITGIWIKSYSFYFVLFGFFKWLKQWSKLYTVSIRKKWDRGSTEAKWSVGQDLTRSGSCLLPPWVRHVISSAQLNVSRLKGNDSLPLNSEFVYKQVSQFLNLYWSICFLWDMDINVPYTLFES